MTAACASGIRNRIVYKMEQHKECLHAQQNGPRTTISGIPDFVGLRDDKEAVSATREGS
jgi:hypothetical protein